MKKDIDMKTEQEIIEKDLPLWLIELHDSIFEELPASERASFHVQFFKRIPAGVNLEPVQHLIAIDRLDRLIVQQNVTLETDIHIKIKTWIREVIAAFEIGKRAHQAAASGNACDFSAVDSALRSALRSAAHSAVYTAADSALYSSVYWAAWSAVYAALCSVALSASNSVALSAANSAASLAVNSAVYTAADSVEWAAAWSAERESLFAALEKVLP